jgi:squalene synthase HpnC
MSAEVYANSRSPGERLYYSRSWHGEEASNEFCRQYALLNYENFSIASFLIPAQLRKHFYRIYSFCRWSDDLADLSESPETATAEIDRWRQQLVRCFEGKSEESGDHAIFVALSGTLRQFGLSREPFHALLDAFTQDQYVFRYQDDSQLLDYCRRSANPVGRILLELAQVRGDDCLRWSDQICTGLQLINFAQDIKRDAEIGRIYLPRTRWQRLGICEDDILRGQATMPLCQSVINWVDDIRLYFIEGWELHKHVPGWLSRDVRLFASGGLEVAKAISIHRGDVWTRRLEVSKLAKMQILLRTFFSKSIPKHAFDPRSSFPKNS